MSTLKLELQSTYGERFKRLTEAKVATLTGNKLLIEEIKVAELKTASGIVLAAKTEGYAKSSMQAGLTHVGIVLMTGEDAKLPGSERELKVGDIVWVAEMGVRPCTNFPGMVDLTDETLQLTTTDMVHMIFEGLEGYQKAMNALAD